jgi:hypothetical protein
VQAKGSAKRAGLRYSFFVFDLGESGTNNLSLPEQFMLKYRSFVSFSSSSVKRGGAKAGGEGTVQVRRC